MSEKPVRVSYIISTRNRAQFLSRTLANVREYIGAEDELIVTDGASTDETSKVVAANRDIVSVFISEPDKGEAHGFNKGIMVSRGRIIKPVTDDDVIYPDGMRQAIQIMEAHPEMDALLGGGESYVFDPATGTETFKNFIFLPRGIKLSSDFGNFIRYTTCGVGLVLRSRVVALAGLFDTATRAVDTQYFSRLIRSGADFRYAHIRLFRHVTYPHSGSQRCATTYADYYDDRVRACMHVGRLDLVQLDKSSGLAALGLNGLPHGRALERLFFYGEGMRRSPFRVFLPPLAATVGGLYHSANRLRKLAKGFRSAAPSVVPKEMDWDGSLR